VAMMLAATTQIYLVVLLIRQTLHAMPA
jgi:hypothetical protein